MKSVKMIIRIIVAFIIAVSTILFLVVNLASSTILSESYVFAKLEEHDYYNKIYDAVKSNFENYISQSGLDESVLENVVSIEKVKKDTQIIIGNIYDGTSDKIDTQEIKDNLNSNIEKSLGTNLVNAQKDAINTFIEKICDEYTSTISHYKYEEQINSVYQRINMKIDMAKKALLVIIAANIIILFILSTRRIYKAFVMTGISAVTSGIFFIAVNIFINIKVKVHTILILNDTISEVLRSILGELLNNINIYGIVLLSAGLLFIIISNLINNILKYKNDEDEA